jgi:hypothetical protein
MVGLTGDEEFEYFRGVFSCCQEQHRLNGALTTMRSSKVAITTIGGQAELAFFLIFVMIKSRSCTGVVALTYLDQLWSC